jgi:tetratricopeptide (TPR) repeat protein
VDEDAVQLEWSDEFQADKGTYVRGFSGQMLIAERMIEDGHAARALEILQSLQITAPQDRELMNNLSIALKVLGREQEAFDVLRKALEAHPDFHLFHFNIAVIHEQRGSADLALTHYDRAIELDPSLYAAYERKYGVLVDQQQYEQALVVLDEAARYGRTRPTTLLYAGLVAATLGKWDLAIEKLQQALVLDPNFARAQLFLGRSLAEAGQFEAAYEALESAAKMGANGHDVTAARIRLRDLQAGASAAVAPEVGSPEAIVPKIGAPE